jgi:hypothetical protein
MFLKDPLTPKQAVETALRVLVAWTDWRQPAERDLGILKIAFPFWADLPQDQLACHVIQSLSQAFTQPLQDKDYMDNTAA